MIINIYTDGAARGNPGPGGYGIVMEAGEYRREFSAGFRKTTNNRMELLAVIEALRKVKQEGHDIRIYSDSKYVVDAIEKKWLFRWESKAFAGRKNPDLWRQLLPLLRQHQPRFFWVKGHNDHPQNERCDRLAVEASHRSGLGPDQFYESQAKAS